MALMVHHQKAPSPEKVPSVINYERLAALVGDPKLQNRLRKSSAVTLKEDQNRETALVPIDHKTFMKEYKSIFLTDSQQREGKRQRKLDNFYRNKKRSIEELPAIECKVKNVTIDATPNGKELMIASTAENEDSAWSIDVIAPNYNQQQKSQECLVQELLQRDQHERYYGDRRIERHIKKLRPPKIQKQGKLMPVLPRKLCARLEKLLARLPYDRSYEESIHVLNILQNYEPVARQMPVYQLKELVITATIEMFEENNVSVFASSGFHIVLAGSVKPLSTPYVEYLDEITDETESSLPRMNTDDEKKRNSSSTQPPPPAPPTSTVSREKTLSGGGGGGGGEEDASLLAELLHHDATSMSLTSQPTLPPIVETGVETEQSQISRGSLRRRVSFIDDQVETAAAEKVPATPTSSSQPSQQKQKSSPPTANSSSNKNNSNSGPVKASPPTNEDAADAPRTADTVDTFEQIEMVRQATLEGSQTGRRSSMLKHSVILRAGECFGTLRNRTAGDGSDVMLCRVNEPKTVILKLSATSYDRISKALTQRQLDKKVNLISTCQAYRYWSRLSLEHLAKCTSWMRFPPGTVLAAEGEVCPYAGYLLSGECRIARRIYVKEVLRNNHEVKRRKEVIMGTFHPGNSFGEKCLMDGQKMRFTLITVSDCEFAIVNDEAIRDLDNGVKQLLGQIEPTGPALEASLFEEDEIYQEYIKQESDAKWSEFKRRVVNDVINFQGIMPGYGRWSKS